MFRKKASASSDSASRAHLRRPGQTLEAGEAAHPTLGSSGEEGQEKGEGGLEAPIPAAISDDRSLQQRPRKRARPASASADLHLPSATSSASPAALPPSPPPLPPAPPASSGAAPLLLSISSSRSALPDLSSHSHQHARFAPKHQPTSPPPSSSSPFASSSSPPPLSLPSTSVLPSLRLNVVPLSSSSARFGPQKASGYARAISRFDYQPDVCVAAGTPVTLAKGSSKAIERVVAGDWVLSFDRSRNGLVPMRVSSDAQCNGVQDCIELLLSDATTLTVTADHLILTDAKRWVRAGDLVVGQSHVSMGVQYPVQSAEELDLPSTPAVSSASTTPPTASAAAAELGVGQRLGLEKRRHKARAQEEGLEDGEPPAAAHSFQQLPVGSRSRGGSRSRSGSRQGVHGVRVCADTLPMFRAQLLAARCVGPRVVYDLSVPQVQEDDRSFVACGVVVHNCKDWLECGSCGYGDSCKFLHDRLDYKAGWQLEAEWEEKQKREEAKRVEDRERRERGETVVDDGGRRRQLPFACFLCRRPFTRPVVTSCGHYFDEACALARFKKTTRCAVCGKETNGSLQTATDIPTVNAPNSQRAEQKAGADEDEDHDREDPIADTHRLSVR